MKISLVAFTLILCFAKDITAQQKPLRLWYNEPAGYWEAGLPLGNGRLGIMPDGGVVKESIVINDITLWSGGVQAADKPDAYKYLPQIRQLLFEGKNIEAQEVMGKYFVCQGPGSGKGNGANVPYGSYQVLGNFDIHYDYGSDSAFIHPVNYQRELLLDSAIAKTKFTIDNTVYRREYFTSFDDDVIVVKLSASQLKKINFTLKLNRPERFETKTSGDELQMSGRLNNGIDGKGMQYIVRVTIKPDGGRLIPGNNSLQLKDANSAVIYISTSTDYRNPRYLRSSATMLANALKKPYAAEKANHIKKFRQFFQRVIFNLGGTVKDSVPTDERLKAYAANTEDNGLPVLYYQYGRYLLICSTRHGLLPPNLQGLWANTMETPWNGDYHLDINIQMNHWPLEVTNLAELNEPFFKLVKGLVIPGEKTAETYYHSKGWVAHVITNIWGYTSPGEDYSWGSYNTGSAWLCQMLWNHYEFTRDTAYLKKLYPILKGSAEFYLGMLVREPSHNWLVTAPSNSPENAFILPDGKRANVCMGPTIDNQIIRHLFSATIECCGRLKADDEFKESLEKAVKQLPPNRIGKDGRLMEWLEEYKEAEPHHRHVSHLWGLYPGNEINMETPALANAAKASLEARGDEGTGWSIAWKINFWARLHDGNRAFALLRKLLRPVKGSEVNMSNGGGTYANLFCGHPPFQIDGNFGGTAGIAEMLLQSQNGYIEFLPALPGEWKDGSFSGWCARGGAVVDAQWTNATLNKVVIKATVDNTFKIKMPANVTKVERRKKEKLVATQPVDNFLLLTLKKGETAEIHFR